MRCSMKKLILLICALSALVVCTGCSSIFASYREIEQLQLVQTIGLDIHPDGGTTLTAAAGQSSGETDLIMSADGSGITDAMRRLQSFSTREDIFYAHTKYALLGENTAVSGIGGILDFVQRAGQIRTDIGLLVLRGCTAEELITRSSSANGNITDALSTLDRSTVREGTGHIFSCQEITRSLAEQNSALICAVTAEETEGIIFSDSGELAAVSLGYGILKNDRLCGYITGETARGINLLLGTGGCGDLDIELPRRISLNIRKTKCHIRPIWQNEQLLAVEVSCDLNCAVAELDRSGAVLSLEEYVAAERAVQDKVSGWLKDILELQRLYDTDFLGLFRKIRAASPFRFAKIEGDWPQPLRNVEYRVQVTAAIERDYDLRSPDK